MAYDMVIKSGLVLDGSGNEPMVADVGIKGDQITAVGNLQDAEAKTVIPALGKYVVPGFIDITNHSDTHLTLFRYPELESMVMQGVTTILGGNCGASLAPLASPEALHAIDKWADTSLINVNWNTVEEFLNAMERLKLGVNFGTCVGFSTLKRGVIGDEIRALKLDEREKIKYLLADAIRQGAWGLSLGLSYGHERVSATDELIDIARGMNATGGLLKIHLRSEGAEILSAINEVIRIGRETELPIQISHLKSIGKKAWRLLPQGLEMIQRANESGLKIHFDVSPYATTGSLLYLLIPAWARRGGFAELFHRLDDREQRGRIIEDIATTTLHFDKLLITSAKIKNIVGKTLQEIARTTGLAPEEALLQTVRANEGRVSIIGRTLSYHNTKTAILHPYGFVASDGEGYAPRELTGGNLVHPRSFGTFPHFWHRMVTDLKLLRPEAAVQKITALPAEKYQLERRGRLVPQHYADVVVFDPSKMRDAATYRNPFQYPQGIEWVIINGIAAVARGEYQATRSGKMLRRRTQKKRPTAP